MSEDLKDFLDNQLKTERREPPPPQQQKHNNVPAYLWFAFGILVLLSALYILTPRTKVVEVVTANTDQTLTGTPVPPCVKEQKTYTLPPSEELTFKNRYNCALLWARTDVGAMQFKVNDGKWQDWDWDKVYSNPSIPIEKVTIRMKPGESAVGTFRITYQNPKDPRN